MKKKVFLLIALLLICLTGVAFASATGGAGIDDNVNPEDSSAGSQGANNDNEQPTVVEKEVEVVLTKNSIDRFNLPGQETKLFISQGIAVIPGHKGRYVIMSYCPTKNYKKDKNDKAKKDCPPSQLVLFDLTKSKKDAAIARFPLYYSKANAETNTDTNTGTETSTDTGTGTSAGTGTDTSTDTGTEISVASTENSGDDDDDDDDDDDEGNSQEADNNKPKEDKKYTGHAGGVAIAGNYIWVSSNFQIRAFKLEDVTEVIEDITKAKKITEKHKEYPKSLKELPAKDIVAVNLKELGVDSNGTTYRVDSRASFVSYDKKHSVLWVGEYIRPATEKEKNLKKKERNYPVAIKHHKLQLKKQERIGWVAGYKVDKDGLPTSKKTYTYTDKEGMLKEKKQTVHIPDYAMAIRRKAQGIAFCGDKIALALSDGIKTSRIYVFNNPLENDKTKKGSKAKWSKKNAKNKEIKAVKKEEGYSKSLKCWTLDPSKRYGKVKKITRAGIQDLAYEDGYLYTNFICNFKAFIENHKKNQSKIKRDKNNPNDFYRIKLSNNIKAK